MMFSLLNPYLGKIILDNGILGKNAALFLKVTALSVTIYCLRMGSDRGAAFLKNYLGRKIKISLTRDVFKKISRMSLRTFRDKSAGDYISRIQTDIAFSSNIIASSPVDIVKAIFKMVIISAIISFIDPRILLLVFLYQAIAFTLVNIFTKKSEILHKAAYEKTRDMAKILTQVFSQIYFVKATGSAFFMFKKYFRSFAESMRVESSVFKVETGYAIASELSNKLFFGLIGLAGTLMVIKGRLTLGSLAAIMAYLSQGVASFTELLNLAQRIILSKLSLERTDELLNAGTHIEEKPGVLDVKFGGRIELQNVGFGYESSRYVLDGMNFVIEPRAKVGLVGPSGCGKTTIANLILRLYDVDQGRILLDGSDLRDMRLRSVYNQIGVALQTPFIWNDSIRNNIEYGGVKLDDASLVKAAKLAQIHSLIDSLPAGYDTLLADMVCPLSQGQKQRIAIARAIAKNPRILILDEACSSLDSQNETMIINNIITAFPQTTLIFISHRLSAIAKMEKIYYLESPAKMRTGTHQQLLRSNPKYNELFASQMEVRPA